MLRIAALTSIGLLALTGCRITPEEIAQIRDRAEVVDAENDLLRAEINFLKTRCTKELELEVLDGEPTPLPGGSADPGGC